MRIKPELIISNAKQLSTELSDMYQNALTSERETAPYKPRLRPSSLPICSLRLAVASMNHTIGYPDTETFTGDFFMNIGTSVHSTMERWASQPGFRLWGNWECVECKHKWKYTDDNVCPKGCELPAKYEEIEIEYMGWTGHIDIILLTPTGVLIGDYKTSSNYGTQKPSYRDHNMAYPLQIMAYTYMMHRVWGKHFLKKYKLKIRGCSLLFICRDNPFKSREFYWPASFGIPTGRKILVHGFISWRAANRTIDNRDIQYALKKRNCRDAKHYKGVVKKFHTYSDCHLYDICVGSRTKNFKQLKELFAEYFDELAEL